MVRLTENILEGKLERGPVAQGVQEKLCFLSKNFQCFATLTLSLWAAIGRSEKGQPRGVTVHSHCVETLEICNNMSARDGLQLICKKKKHFFRNTL